MKKAVSILLSLVLVCALLPAARAAEEETPSPLTAGGAITLEEDLILTEDVTITSDSVIDLNGHTVTGQVLSVKPSGEYTSTTVTSINVHSGVTVTLKNGTLKNVTLRNYGGMPLITGLTVENEAAPCIQNSGTIDHLERCTLTSSGTYTDLNSTGVFGGGRFGMIDNCDITARMVVINPSILRHCRIRTFEGGHSALRVSNESVVDDCVICGEIGAFIQQGGSLTLTNSTVISTDRAPLGGSGTLYHPAVEILTNGSAAVKDCTLIARGSAVALVRQSGGAWESEDLSSEAEDCIYMPLDYAGDLARFTEWTMESVPTAAQKLARFTVVNSYRPGQFADVPETHWGAANVAKAYMLGLMKGTDDGFVPEGKVTLATAVTMAARIHSIYSNGAEHFDQSEGAHWYDTYVNYARRNGILSFDYPDYERDATRAQFAVILAAALPAEALPQINEIADDDIPDVKMTDASAQAIYRLYRAGILTGSDEYGTFHSRDSIDRASASAIITRMADVSLRRAVTLTPIELPDETVPLTEEPVIPEEPEIPEDPEIPDDPDPEIPDDPDPEIPDDPDPETPDDPDPEIPDDPDPETPDDPDPEIPDDPDPETPDDPDPETPDDPDPETPDDPDPGEPDPEPTPDEPAPDEPAPDEPVPDEPNPDEP